MKWTVICLIVILTLISIQGILYAGIGGYEPDNDPGPDDPGRPVNPLVGAAFCIGAFLLFLFYLLPNWIRDKFAEMAEKKANSATEKTEEKKDKERLTEQKPFNIYPCIHCGIPLSIISAMEGKKVTCPCCNKDFIYDPAIQQKNLNYALGPTEDILCVKCGALLKVPSGKGKFAARCNICNYEFYYDPYLGKLKKI